MNAVTLSLAFLFCLSGIATTPRSKCLQDLQLQVLNHYEGVWDCRFTISPQQEAAEDRTFTGVVEGKWVVGEKFLEQKGSYRLSDASPLLVIRTMMSFDKKQKRYQYDYFNSSGEVHRSFGKWDDEAKTMTSTMTDGENGNITTIVADFSTAGTEQWTIETKDSNGNITTRIAGTNTRRPNK